MNRPSGSEHWRWHLASLPEVEPPATLWARLQATRDARMRRHRGGWSIAAAAGVLLATALLLARQPEAPAPRAEVGRSAADAPGATAAVDPGLRRLDDEIALAYAREAGADELTALWDTRARLLQSLQGPAPALLVRL